MIKVKNIDILLSFVNWHPKLKDVVIWFDFTFPGKLCITDGYRKGDKGCHGTEPLRAIDQRSWVFQDPKAIADKINAEWEYDPARSGKYLVCLYHKTKSGSPHFHIQVSDHTRRR